MIVRLPRALHSGGRVPSRVLLYISLKVRVVGGTTTAATAAVVSAVTITITINQRKGGRWGEDIIIRGSHSLVRLPRALHSRGRVPVRPNCPRDLVVWREAQEGQHHRS